MTSKTKATSHGAVQTRSPTPLNDLLKPQFPNLLGARSPVPWHPMNASTLAGPARPTLRIRGTAYPILLPTVRDPRLHLAAVIISLQVLGQTAFGFQLSIAQILVSLLTCAVIEFAITFHQPARDHVARERASDRERRRLHPARAGHAARRLVEHEGLVDLRRHGRGLDPLEARDPASAGTTSSTPRTSASCSASCCSAPTRADPLAFWWGPMSPWMALALAIILVGAFAILSRLHLLAIAVTFWLAFAAGIAVIAASGHQMTARWHLGPITGFEFWRVLVLSPEVMIFLFFMITDPKTTPSGPGRPPGLRRLGRAPRGAADRAADDGVLDEGRAARRALDRLRGAAGGRGAGAAAAAVVRPAGPAHAGRRGARAERRRSPACSCSPASRRRPEAAVASAAPANVGRPAAGDGASVEGRRDADRRRSSRGRSPPTSSPISGSRRTRSARRDKARAAEAAGGKRLQGLWQQISGAGDERDHRPAAARRPRSSSSSSRRSARTRRSSSRRRRAPSGSSRSTGTPAAVAFRGNTTPFTRTLELQLDGGALPHRRLARRHARGGRARLVGAARLLRASAAPACRTSPPQVGIDFQQSAFRPPRRTT